MRRTVLLVLICCLLSDPAMAQSWGSTEYRGEPWVSNASQPYKVTRGLENRHLSLWASHGRYYDTDRECWRWQRPTLFCTNEDLYTQTIVVPYLIPMLENAGAVVFTPRERDWQRHEVIVDNDDHTSLVRYLEVGFKQPWQTTGQPGFALHHGPYRDGENPFTAGTARMAKATSSKSKYSQISYQPDLPEAGRYAVYVSYQTLENSVDDAHYTVWHRGEKTELRVNQRMGGSTWVYLGTFDFDRGSSQFNRVVLTNQSSRHGVVTADAVRFGGGMGNILRGGQVSGLPRCLEGARYGAQWMGIPNEVYVQRDDYKDDINIRSKALNYVAGGSCYIPDTTGLKVPIELSLAVHSDAGYAPDGASVYGTLSICTTDNAGQSHFRSGLSRQASKRLAEDLLNNLTADLRAKYGHWTPRASFDRNYSETRLPDVPSAIIETLSHQSFPDMRYGEDPNFRFTLARSLYKTILRYVNRMHGDDCVVTPLAPTHLQVELNIRKGEARLTWQPTDDPQEPSADATGFVVYTATDHSDFDNGIHVRHTSHTVKLDPGVTYSFRVAATNKGGRSFPSEVVSVRYMPDSYRKVLVVNGFHRLSSPAIVCNDSLQGFDLDLDPGVSYGRTAGWTGRQTVFHRSFMGIEGETGLGYGTEELAGMFVAGNDFDYVRTHANAIAATDFNVASCSVDAVEDGQVNLGDYDAVDLILGLEYDDGHSLVPYKTFTPRLQQLLRQFTQQGGGLLVSGAYVGSDTWHSATDRQFLSDVLKCTYGGKDDSPTDLVSGMGTQFSFYRDLNEQHYAATRPDILQATGSSSAYATMAYASGYGAAVAYSGNDYRAFTMGFPLECIKSTQQQADVMAAILSFITLK